jgi:hypothetical protein
MEASKCMIVSPYRQDMFMLQYLPAITKKDYDVESGYYHPQVKSQQQHTTIQLFLGHGM